MINECTLVYKTIFRLLLHRLLLPRVVCGQVLDLELKWEIAFLILKTTLLMYNWPLDRLRSKVEILNQLVLLSKFLRSHRSTTSLVVLLC